MLILCTEDAELYDEETSTLIKVPSKELIFEHSLKSLSMWEAKYKKAFLGTNNKSPEETMDYLAMMCTSEILDPVELTPSMVKELTDYIADPHTATVIRSSNSHNSRMTMTSEVIYAYMANGQIPFTCEEWNLNNLLKLISVLGELNNPKQMSKKDILSENDRLNEERKRKLHTKG